MNNWQCEYTRKGNRVSGDCWLCGSFSPINYFVTKLNNWVSPACDFCKEVIQVVETADGYVDHVTVGETKIDFSSENVRIFVKGQEAPIDWCDCEFELETFRVKFKGLLSFFAPYTQEFGEEYSYKAGFQLFGHYADQVADYSSLTIEELEKRLCKESWSNLGTVVVEEGTTHCSKTGDMTEHFSKLEKYEHPRGTLIVVYKGQTDYVERCRRDKFLQTKTTSEWQLYSVYFEIS